MAISLLKRMASKKVQDWKNRDNETARTPVPLGLHQGSVAEISALSTVMNQTNGGLIPSGLDLSQPIVAVGSLNLFGQHVYRAYLHDGASFIQVAVSPTDRDNPLECRFYTMFQEWIPTSEQVWEFLLDEGDGYVGYPEFQVPHPTSGEQVSFSRIWSPGETRIMPVEADESVLEADGDRFRMSHEMMQYGRVLGAENDPNAENEFLLVSVSRQENEASMTIFIGIDVDIDTGSLKVYTV